MAIDFPASPTDGQTFTGASGYVYIYSTASGAWLLQSTGISSTPGPAGPAGPAGAPGSCTISDTAPGSPINGQMWWNSTNGNLYISYNDGDSTQWVQINTVGT